MEITLKIERRGYQRGSVAWLARTARAVILTHNEDDELIAWLIIEENGQRWGQCLAFQNSDKYDVLARYAATYPHPFLVLAVTDACWSSILRLAEQARELLEAGVAAEEPIRFSLVEVKSHD